MPTNEERREIAARLRDMAPGPDWPWYVAEACGMDVSKMSGHFHAYTAQLCRRLADLICPYGESDADTGAVEELQGRVLDCAKALGLDTFGKDSDALLDEIAALAPRIMPEGLQWPCFEDGDKICLGDDVECVDVFGIKSIDAKSIEFHLSDAGGRAVIVKDGATFFNAGFSTMRKPTPDSWDQLWEDMAGGHGACCEPDKEEFIYRAKKLATGKEER